MSDGSDTPTPNRPTEAKRNRRLVGDRRNWLTIARKEFADAGRAWQFYVLGSVFTVAMLYGGLEPVLTAMIHDLPDQVSDSSDGLIAIAGVTRFVVALVGLLVGHGAIAGQIERGSLRTLLAFPVSRRDVLLGTLAGRVAVLWATLAVGLGVTSFAMWFVYDDLAVLAYVGFSAAVLAFSVVFVAMGVGISAASRTRGRALGWAMTAFVVTTLVWDLLLFLLRAVTNVSPVRYAHNPDRAPGWYVFLDRAEPGTAWRYVVSNWIVPVFSNTRVGETRFDPRLTTHGPEPFYVQEWTLVAVLLAWALVPLAVGYWRFQTAEIV